MKKLIKTVFVAKQRTVLIHDPIEALIARMCDPLDPIYDDNVAKAHKEYENTKSR